MKSKQLPSLNFEKQITKIHRKDVKNVEQLEVEDEFEVDEIKMREIGIQCELGSDSFRSIYGSISDTDKG